MKGKNRHMSKILDIGLLFLGDYHGSYTGREIARRLKVSPQTALSQLNVLVEERLFLCVTEGRNYRYGINKRNLRTKIFLQAAELQKSNLFLENDEFQSIISSLLPFAETLIVFGSFAKGAQKEDSDVDIIVINGNAEKLHKIAGTFPRKVSMEIVSWKQFLSALREKRPLALEVRKDHLIYGNVFKVVEVYCSE